MSKKNRLEAILSLIDKYEIDTQEELTQKLNEEGFDVSQATVSRDINELNLTKGEGIVKKYKYIKPVIYSGEIPDKTKQLLEQILVSVECANNLVVVKTRVGSANTMAALLDELHFEHVLGTIAGDDTLLIIVKTNSDAESVKKGLKNL